MKTLLVDSGREPIADILNVWSVWPDWELLVWTDRPDWYRQFVKTKLIEPLPNWMQNMWAWSKNKLHLSGRFLILVTAEDKLQYTEKALKAGWPVIWLETPVSDADLVKLSKLSVKVYKIVCLTDSMRDLRLSAHWSDDNMLVCSPVITVINTEKSLVKPAVSMKIGVIADLSVRQHLEEFLKLIGAAKEIGLFLDVTIVGDGAYRSQLIWLIKQMSLERIVKTVGARLDLDGWITGFDYLAVVNENPDILDLLNGIKALAYGVPVLGPNLPVLQDVIKPTQSGEYLDWSKPDDNLALLKALADDPIKQKQLKKGASDYFKSKFNSEEALGDWKKVFYK